MTSPYAERKVIENEKKENDPEKTRRIVEGIVKRYELFGLIEALLIEYKKAIFVPDNEIKKFQMKWVMQFQ